MTNKMNRLRDGILYVHKKAIDLLDELFDKKPEDHEFLENLYVYSKNSLSISGYPIRSNPNNSEIYLGKMNDNGNESKVIIKKVCNKDRLKKELDAIQILKSLDITSQNLPSYNFDENIPDVIITESVGYSLRHSRHGFHCHY